MVVEAEFFYWTASGMRPSGNGDAYLTVREAERLLTEAHERGWRAGLEAANEIIRERRLS